METQKHPLPPQPSPVPAFSLFPHPLCPEATAVSSWRFLHLSTHPGGCSVRYLLRGQHLLHHAVMFRRIVAVVGRREGPVGAGEDKQKVVFDYIVSGNQDPGSYADFHRRTAENRAKHRTADVCHPELKLAKLGTTESCLT